VQVDPLAYFKTYPIIDNACLLLDLEWRQQLGELRATYVLMDSPREFTLLRFSGVTDLVHRTYRDRAGHPYQDSCLGEWRTRSINQGRALGTTLEPRSRRG
jgi:hypothetical protein